MRLSPAMAKNAAQRLANLDWVFEPNVGQVASPVKFLARANDSTVFLTGNGIDISWAASTSKVREGRSATSDSLELEFVGANRGNQPTGETVLPGKTNYLIGRDALDWHTNISHYAAVRYAQLYPGVAAKFYGGSQGLEYDLTAAPNADLRRILLRMKGAGPFDRDAHGNLMMRVGARQLVMKRPSIYQVVGRSRVDVNGGYRLVGSNTVGFTIAKHRADLPLVIDPAISVAFATFLGGNGAEKGNSVVVASDAVTGDTDAFVGGTTTDITSFPEMTACNDVKSATCGGGAAGAVSNLFVAKVDLSTSPPTLVYLTFIGGSGNDQGGLVAVDNSPGSASPAGSPNLAILGWTTSTDFPVTLGSVPAGSVNLTVSKLNGAGNAFIYSEYYGGSGMEATQGTGTIVSNPIGGGIATDSAGDVFVTSDTTSTDLPQLSTPNGFQTMFEGTGTPPASPNNDGFLAKFDPNGSLLYSTYFGITATIGSTGVAVDSSGNAYVAGFTSSPTTFPATNPFQASYGGGNSDGFVMEINPAPLLGSPGLVYASLLGGSQSDQALSIAVDTSNPADAYVTGLTQSSDLIPSSGVTNAPFQPSLGTAATQNGFFGAISQSGGVPSLQYITYLGGSGTDVAQAVNVISPTQVYVAGTTTSTNFPSICSLQGFTGTQDAFLAQFNPTAAGAASLLGTTLLGGTVTAEANSVSADSVGNAILFGDSISPDFPLAGNPNTGFQPICTSCAATPPLSDAVLTKVTVNSSASGCLDFDPGAANFGSFADGTTSPPVDVLVTNDGSAALNVSSVTITGPNFSDFSLTINTCPASSPISPGKTCDLATTFDPSIIGPETASLQVSDDGIGSPQTLTLNGTGTGVGVTLSPGNTLNFANTAQGAVSTPQSVTLTNTGSDNVNITQLPFQGTNPADFELSTSNTCASTASVLAPGTQCTIAVQFAPNEPNPPAGGLSLTAQDALSVADAVNNSTQTVTVSLSGTELPATPAIVFAPASLNFNSENVGSASAAQLITVTNTGSAPLAISSISVTGANTGDFPETNTCPTAPATVAINGTCTISVRFQPTATGPRSAAVSVSDNANASPQTVALTGTGTAAGVTLTPSSLTFAGQNAGTPPSTPQTITLQNTGSGPLTISSIGITGANSGDFAETNNCPGSSATLNVGQACSIAVTFAPAGTGPRSASFAVADDAVPSPQIVSLNGTGTMPAVHLNLSSMAFASGIVGGVTASQQAQVTNTGNGPLVITNVGFTGANPGDFQASGSCVGAGGSAVSIAAGSSCTVNVAFSPTATGSRSASLSVTDNAANSPQQLSVSGTATDFQLGVGAGGSTSTTLTAGETATFNLQATPVNNFFGTIAMSCSDPMPASTCALSPQQVVVSGSQPVGFSVTVTSTAHSALPQLFRRIPPGSRRLLLLGSLLAFAFLWLWSWRWHRSRFRLAFLLGGALLLCSCGGGSTNASSNGTPPGTYTVAATGTSSGASRTVNLTITVQ
ncbi:MAG TPA: choice-of-anchor D domain-containing protein [Candidatus Acidoferrales bacterium]|nr:choice-of-anchor D domain-containing protein [Candidatus Acidoferrales bacterium]